MAQRARPDLNSTLIDRTGWTAKQPEGNPRIGPGQGGTDKPVVARLPYQPSLITQGDTKDSRFRQGPQ
jgi:hypothetical protein